MAGRQSDMAITEPLTERRQLARVEWSKRVELELLSLQRRLAADSINFNEGGMCVRVQEALEISSSVRLRWVPEAAARPVECGGRIAWVIQRLDLRDVPPFLYDVGVQFINPPARVRQFASRIGVAVKAMVRAPRASAWQPLRVRDRCYTPRLQQESSAQGSWHLVVTIDGMPCFSGRYASERQARQEWERFKRQVSRKGASR